MSIIKFFKKMKMVFSGPLFSDVAEEDEYVSDDEEDEMANFIVDHGKYYGKGAPIRYYAFMNPLNLLL